MQRIDQQCFFLENLFKTVLENIVDMYIMYYKVTYIISLKEFSMSLALIASGTCVDQHNDGTAEVSFSTRHCCSYGRANVPVDIIKGT